MKVFLSLIFVLFGGFGLIQAEEPETSLSEPVPQASKWPPPGEEIIDLYENGNKKDAFSRAKAWLKEEKKSGEPWAVWAALYFKEGDFKKALKYGKKALKRAPQNAQAYFWRGKAYEALDKPLEAANEFRAALFADQAFPKAEEGLRRAQAQFNSEEE